MNLESFSALSIKGVDLPLSIYQGKVVLVVNVASHCGFTGQYAGLEALYKDYGDEGFVVLGFPCDQFGHQEPANEDTILMFCQSRYDVTFPLFSKLEVNGPRAHPLFQWLKSSKPGLLGTEGIKWNFTKFLVGRDGQVIARYAPTDTPQSLRPDIEQALLA